MKKTIFIILIWVVGFFVGAYICASCNANNKYANKNPTEQTESVATTQQTEPPAQETPPPPICKKSASTTCFLGRMMSLSSLNALPNL